MTVGRSKQTAQFASIVGVVVLLLLSAGCWRNRANKNWSADTSPLRAIDLSDPGSPIDLSGPITLTGARNEWISMAVRLSSWEGERRARLRIAGPEGNTAIPASAIAAYQVVSVPVDTDQASLVRQTGQSSGAGEVPRALLAIPGESSEFDLSQLRDPTAAPGAPAANADGSLPVTLWIDVHIPAATSAGTYRLSIDLLEKPRGRPVVSMPVTVNVLDFVLPDERHLDLVSQLDFASLSRIFPAAFTGVNPRLLNRTDLRYQPAVRTLDRLIALAQAHRASLFVPQLQPTVKWPSGEPPSIDWNDIDSVVTPWLSGNAFADRVPLGFWPIPTPDGIGRFDDRSQAQYWSAAAAHFEQRNWLGRSAVMIEPDNALRVGSADSIRLSTLAATVLRAHERIRAMVPLEQDQVQFAAAANFGQAVRLNTTDRLMVIADGAVHAAPLQSWPRNAPQPTKWLRTDLESLVPSGGVGNGERDIRAWAWLAYLRQAKSILWKDPLPRDANPRRPADPADPIWFYPGEPFGRNEPVPTLALKWLRRAQQDYEYLYLAAQRGETANAQLLAQLITKPVEVQPNQPPDPVYGLLGGTTDPTAWDGAMAIVAKSILLRQPGRLPDLEVQHQLRLETLRWIEPQQRPTLMARSTQWIIDTLTPGGTNWVDLRCGIDIYNTAADTPERNSLQWTGIGAGWRVNQQPMPVPSLSPHRIRRVTMDARVNLAELGPGTREPLVATFTLGFNGRQSQLQFVAPAAATFRRDVPLVVDGSLGDWRDADAIADGPLVKMFDRPSLRQQTLARASTPTSLYTNWADDSLYLAFRTTGIEEAPGRATKNFVDYQLRRAWGEDLCEALIQPIYADNSVGPVLNVTCKPTGTWVERKLDTRTALDPWAPLEGTAVRYAATVDESHIWRGELAIPWKAITDPAKGRPVLLRFNFSTHNAATGESASWAGPVDFGRDENFMGMLQVREGE